MCGIVGYVGKEQAAPILLDGLERLEYRGYDSAGLAVLGGRRGLQVKKSKGRLSVLKALTDNGRSLTGTLGIGHTRWATHGEPNDINSHPHLSEGRNIAVVHNGIIENYVEIKEFLISQGMHFSSETDTEVVAQLLEYFYDSCGDFMASVYRVLDRIEGAYALGIMCKDTPDSFIAARKDAPLLLGYGDGCNFIASDVTALIKHTRDVSYMNDGEVALVSADGIQVFDEYGQPVEKEHSYVDWDVSAAEKGGYPHFMIKEIHEEPDAIIKTVRPRIKNGMPDFGIPELTDERLASFERIHIVACGTAMHAGLIGKYAVEKLARVPVNVEIASEFRYKDPILGKHDLVIIVSQSGETADTLAALRLAKERGVYTLAVVNVAGSSIAREADSVVYTWAGPEIAVASTKAYTVQLAVMYLFALRLAYACGKLDAEKVKALAAELLDIAPQMIQKALDCEKKCAEIAKKYKDNNDIFFIGRGADYALSMESALKLKEISYIHCEAYAAGELKHGTISLITDGTPVFALANYAGLYDKMLSNIKEVRARGARVILLCDENASVPENVADDVLRVPTLDELFMPIPTATLSQLIAYYTALQLGCDVDKPRNLAKSVTVE